MTILYTKFYLSHFDALRACLEKMLRSHVQHLQEELAHVERTAAISSRHLMNSGPSSSRDVLLRQTITLAADFLNVQIMEINAFWLRKYFFHLRGQNMLLKIVSEAKVCFQGRAVETEGGEPPGDARQGHQEQLREAEALGRPHRGPEKGKQVNCGNTIQIYSVYCVQPLAIP